MTKADPSWELYRSFLAVMRSGSLSAAARELSTTQPTIGRHVEALEQALGTTLFVRTPSGLTPNAIASGLVPHAENMEMAAAALVRLASGGADDVGGAVRLAASHIVGTELLPDILTGFHQAHPRIAIELVLSSAASDLLRGEADIAVRMFRPVQDALVARRVGAGRIGLFAHRRYIERHGLPASLAELERHTVIGFDRDMAWTRATASLNVEITREMFSLRCDSEVAQLAALRAGFGIGACHVHVARRDAALVPVLTEHLRFDMEVWVTMHRDLRGVRRVALMFEYLAAALERLYAPG